MRKSSKYKRSVVFLLSLLIIAVLTIFYAVTWRVYYWGLIPLPFWNKGNYLLYALYALLVYLFTKLYGARKIGDWQFGTIVYSQMLSVIWVNVVTYVLILLINRWYISAVPMVMLTVMDFAIIVFWTAFAKYVYHKLYPPRRMLLLYADRDPDMLAEKMSRRKDKYNICEFVNVSVGMNVLKEKIIQYEAVILCDIPSETRNDLVKYCFAKDIRAYVTPKLSDVILLGADNSNVFDSPLLICKNREMSIEKAVAKRLMDLMFIIPICILSSPFMLIIAMLIKWYDRGPVFYKQTRLTLNGETFEIYKFRSMRTDSEHGVAQLAKKDDDRITPVGRVLRATHFDELPQMFNILKGEMSIVGPRPERPEIHAQYREIIPEFDFRLKVKAGLTGYAQVYGKYNTSPYDKLKLDLHYIEHQSLLMDLELILKTVKVIFMKDNTEGIEKWQTTAATKKQKMNGENPKN